MRSPQKQFGRTDETKLCAECLVSEVLREASGPV